VSINEAIDIAKRFGASESGAFVNGILDSIRTALESKELLPVPDAESAQKTPEAANDL
jgi:N utilization substance protein B